MPRIISEKTLLAMKPSQYMNASQRAFFRKRLAVLAHDCEQHIGSARNNLQTPAQADPLDAAVEEESCRHQLRFMAREQALLGKIRAALRRLESGDYGYCKISGEPIGLPRLLARPTTEYCAEVKARLEQNERHYAHQRTG
ncbi:TraR/DksA C4-type zinc finger protein [Alcanivorax sp.]|uniref:TraR/DksA family transcriptional regulator n=1 Tax=Alcanivorax sp. TaxID=1872427 RepID=UPI000C3EB2DD|nr:TraR/DksA C4-type zinc finger protein [Alcanivorax sp.]MBQ23988.1 molecular chaperone DnaK [Alcanivorax sp.]|tara:strand:+ start:195 stop:617 length:423 start_codon:yes stop_codon:yes gene_type:complete